MSKKFEETESGKLFAELRQSVENMIVVPNSWLPEDFQDKVRGGRTLKRLNELCEERYDKMTEHKRIKAIKARNIARLAAQIAEGSTDIDCPLDYSNNERDEMAQYRAECAMVAGMVNGGLVDADDLME
jgi:hypothetical protein